jgi:hypothetical protein
MSRFRHYINEAFSKSSFEKAVKNIRKVLEKSIGSKLYPFYGTDRIEKFNRSGGNGIGIMYIVDKFDSLIRFNWEQKKKSNSITSVDIWDNVTDVDTKPPKATLKIPADFNIIQSLGIIVNFIRKPKIGMISEAKGDKKRALAAEWGLDPDMSYNDIRKAVTKKKKLLAVKGESEKNQIMLDIEKAKKDLDSQKYADPDIVFEDLDDLVRMVASNIQPSLLVSGMAGIGKCLYYNCELDVIFD